MRSGEPAGGDVAVADSVAGMLVEEDEGYYILPMQD